MVEEKTIIKDLILKGAFHCKGCSNILEPPVYLSGTLGNICSSCYNCLNDSSKEVNEPFIPNKALDDLLVKLVFECPFQKFGCNEVVTGGAMRNHKDICKYRPIQCIFRPLCSFQGARKELVKHLTSRHEEEYLRKEQNNFIYEFDMSSPIENATKIFKTSSDVFIFQIRIFNNTLLFAILDPDDNSSKYKFSVTLMGKSLQTSCFLKEYTPDFDLSCNGVYEHDLDMLKKRISSEILTIVINVEDKESKEVIKGSMFHHFECPVCKNFMYAPIFLCQLGHSVCNLCHPKLKQCPTCRNTLTKMRNFSLEALTNEFKYPCVYRDQGCEHIASVMDIASHESSCSFRTYSCCFASCDFSGNSSTVKNHLTNKHASQIIHGHIHNFTISLSSSRCVEKGVHVMIFDDRVFRFTFHGDGQYTYFSVDAYFSESSSKTTAYIYEVGLLDEQQPDERILRTHICLNNVSGEKFSENCCWFPNDVLSKTNSSNNNFLAGDKNLNGYVKIVKKI